MFVTLVFLFSFVQFAISQQSCCAPPQWTGNYRTLQHDGKYSLNSAIVDITNNKAFLATSEDPDINLLMWFLPDQVFKPFFLIIKQGVFYSYDIVDGVCYTDNFTSSINNICVGGGNDTFSSTISIGTSIVNVWQGTRSDGEAVITSVTDSTCIPVSIELDSDAPESKFDQTSVFYNIQRGANNFPPVPPQCSSSAIRKEFQLKKYFFV